MINAQCSRHLNYTKYIKYIILCYVMSYCIVLCILYYIVLYIN